MMYRVIVNNSLYHHGILNQEWGVRNGPPYPLKGGAYSVSEKAAIYKKRKQPNSIYNKKHFDEVLKKDKDTLSTLSYDADRTKNTDMFYATHKTLDRHLYNALFNKPIPQDVVDENGNKIGSSLVTKYRIDNSVAHDIKIASEDSASDIFRKMYANDRDFYNFVTDPDRMESYFVKDKYKFKGYRESKTVLDKIKNDPSYVPKQDEVNSLYRMFNYVIPYDGAGDARKGRDVEVQRAKFFKEAKNAGYGALLDTNDAIYGSFKATSPVIVFDMEAVVPKKTFQTNVNSIPFSAAVTAGRKILNV